MLLIMTLFQNFPTAKKYMQDVFGDKVHYGEICFKNDLKHTALPYYVAFFDSNQTKTKNKYPLNDALLDLLVNRWRLMTPYMVLLPVIRAPTADFDIDTLYRDIVRAAIENQAWFMADASQPEGLRKQITAQRSFKDPIPSVGLLSLDVLVNKESLRHSVSHPDKQDDQKQDKQGHFPAIYTPTKKETEDTKKLKELESHHSHYIMLKGSRDDLRKPTQEFLQFCSKEEKAGKLVVLLLVGGGDKELDKVNRFTKDAPNIHLVVFKGTGGKAGEIAKSIESDNNAAWQALLPNIKNKDCITLIGLEKSSEIAERLADIKIKFSKRNSESLDQDWCGYVKVKGILEMKYYKNDMMNAICADRVQIVEKIIEEERFHLANFLTLERLKKLIKRAIEDDIDIEDADDEDQDKPAKDGKQKLRKGCRGHLSRLLYDEINVNTIIITTFPPQLLLPLLL